MSIFQISDAFQNLLKHATINGEHKAGTPDRVVRMWEEWSRPHPEFNFTVFDNEEEYDQIIMLNGIRFSSKCSHHLLPFSGTAAVGYIPRSKYCGLSKLARTVVYFADTLQTQERLTKQVGTFLLEKLVDPLGVAVVMKAVHTCITCRGVEQPDTVAVTSYMHGAFLEKAEARAELLELIKWSNGHG